MATRQPLPVSVLVAAADVQPGDVVDFGPEAVPPRLWQAVSVDLSASTVSITWRLPVRSPEGYSAAGRAPWSGHYASEAPLRRVRSGAT